MFPKWNVSIIEKVFSQNAILESYLNQDELI